MQHWTDWEMERLISILRFNAEMAAAFRRTDDFDQVDDHGRPMRTTILAGNAFAILSETTKLLAHARGIDWDPADPCLIWEEGNAGFQQVMLRYGLSVRPDGAYEHQVTISTSPNLPSLETISCPPGDLTFATFDLKRPILGSIQWRDSTISECEQRESLAAAFIAAQRYADAPEGWLLITGAIGAGKTHLAAAIFHEARNRGQVALHLSAPPLQRRYKSTDDPRWLEEKPMLLAAHLLIIDDLDIGFGLIWNTYFDQVLRERKEQAHPTVLVLSYANVTLPDWLREQLIEIVVLAGSYRRLPLS